MDTSLQQNSLWWKKLSQARELSKRVQLDNRVKKWNGIWISEKDVLTYLFQSKNLPCLFYTSISGIAWNRLNNVWLK